MANKNLGEILRDLAQNNKPKLQEILSQLSDDEVTDILYDWQIWRRPSQEYSLKWDEQFVLAMCGRGWGKLFYPDTDVLTVNRGWIKLEGIKIGDRVFDENGKPCSVLAVHEPDVKDISQTYELFFSDKTSLKTCGDHRWVTWTHRDRKQFLRKPENGSFPPEDWVNFKKDITKNIKTKGENSKFVQIPTGDYYGGKIRTTQEIIDTFRQNTARKDLNHCIPVCKPLQFSEKSLLIDPYLLGYWFGDGSKGGGSITCGTDDQESLLSYSRNLGYDIYLTNNERKITLYCKGLITLLKELKVDQKDHIPEDYLYNSENNRLKFLQGFMDSDGYTDGKHVEFCTKTQLHADTVYYLAASLGQKPIISEGRATLYGKDYGIKYRVTWTPTINCFYLPRKSEKFNYNNVGQASRQQHRMLTDYKKIDVVKGMRCITVDSPNNMWLVGKNLIPTHNTRWGSETIRQVVHQGVGNITIIAPTSSDLRETIAQGSSGVLACAGPKDKYQPTYIPSKSRIEWSNGAKARLISAEEADRLRGLNSQFIWIDEASSIKDDDVFDQAVFGLRISPAKGIISTTPKATKLMLRLSKRFGDDIKLITGSTYENEGNLDKGFLKNAEEAYGGTRLGKQELLGHLLLASEDALWTPQMIEANTVEPHLIPKMVKYACGVDPASSKGKHSDLTGIVLVGLGEDDRLYILRDYSGKYSPQGWAQKVVNLYDEFSQFGPVTIVVERNAGGDLCIENLTRYRPFLPIKDIFSTANKISRAEPIALLAEQGKLKHVRGGGLSDLEDEMTSFDGLGKQKSPDRLDSMVFAATHLLPSKRSFVTSREFLI